MKNRYLNTIFTNHALNRLYNRGITQSDAWYTFQHPDGSLPGKIPGSKKFYKDYGQQRIEVIAKKNEKGEWIILSCWSRLVGDGRPLFPQEEPLLAKLIKKGLEKIESKIRRKKETRIGLK